MRWIALGSLAMIMLHGTYAEECPSPVTVTKIETTTVWAGTAPKHSGKKVSSFSCLRLSSIYSPMWLLHI